jgi:taurine dioxygenase
MKVRRLGYALGAEVTGIDLRALDDEAARAVRNLWLEHLMLCFPGQTLTKGEFIAFASRFGEIEGHRETYTIDPEDTRVLLITNTDLQGKPFVGFRIGERWHSDGSHRKQPNLGSFLYARELPPAGGDTMFANQSRAYESLSEKLRGILDGLDAVHDHQKVSKLPPIVHPAVKTHPETRRKALYVGERVRQFKGMTEEESRPLVDFLVRRAVSYEFTYRHRWSVDDVVMWDNRCLMHIATGDYDIGKDPRLLWRCSLLAEATGVFYDDAEGAQELVKGVAQ